MSEALISDVELKPSQFAWVSSVVRDLCGINLHEGKMALVKARLHKRLRLLKLNTFGEYVDYVRNEPDGSELSAMLEALSTNLTYFFREPHHFDVLKQRVIPAMLARHREDRRIRIWSAGCSSGEEPYSIAITLQEAAANLAGWDVGILATDLAQKMLTIGQRATYAEERLRETPRHLIHKYFELAQDQERLKYRVNAGVRRWVEFAELNLMDHWPMRGKFDVIFCRNVMIYFDKATQAHLIERLWSQLTPGGVLFIGHSESLAGIAHRFRYIQPTVYEKPLGRESQGQA